MVFDQFIVAILYLKHSILFGITKENSSQHLMIGQKKLFNMIFLRKMN